MSASRWGSSTALSVSRMLRCRCRTRAGLGKLPHRLFLVCDQLTRICMPLGKLARVVREELSGLHPRLLLIQALLAPLPAHVGSRMRVYALRAAGFQIGHG